MLPSRFDDPEFRGQFAERVETDTRRIEAVIETLARLGGTSRRSARRSTSRRCWRGCSSASARASASAGSWCWRNSTVPSPRVLGDAEQLRFAFGLLLEQALGWMPERGDLYVATRHQRAREDGDASLRILLRFRAPTGDGLGFGDNALAVAAVDAVVRAHGGSLVARVRRRWRSHRPDRVAGASAAAEHATTR